MMWAPRPTFIKIWESYLGKYFKIGLFTWNDPYADQDKHDEKSYKIELGKKCWWSKKSHRNNVLHHTTLRKREIEKKEHKESRISQMKLLKTINWQSQYKPGKWSFRATTKEQEYV